MAFPFSIPRSIADSSQARDSLRGASGHFNDVGHEKAGRRGRLLIEDFGPIGDDVIIVGISVATAPPAAGGTVVVIAGHHYATDSAMRQTKTKSASQKVFLPPAQSRLTFFAGNIETFTD